MYAVFNKKPVKKKMLPKHKRIVQLSNKKAKDKTLLYLVHAYSGMVGSTDFVNYDRYLTKMERIIPEHKGPILFAEPYSYYEDLRNFMKKQDSKGPRYLVSNNYFKKEVSAEPLCGWEKLFNFLDSFNADNIIVGGSFLEHCVKRSYDILKKFCDTPVKMYKGLSLTVEKNVSMRTLIRQS